MDRPGETVLVNRKMVECPPGCSMLVDYAVKISPDFAKYEALRNAGSSPVEVSRCAAADGLRSLEIVLVLKTVFKMTLVEAKEVWLQAEGIAESLSDYQERVILPALQEALQEIERDSD